VSAAAVRVQGSLITSTPVSATLASSSSRQAKSRSSRSHRLTPSTRPTSSANSRRACKPRTASLATAGKSPRSLPNQTSPTTRCTTASWSFLRRMECGTICLPWTLSTLYTPSWRSGDTGLPIIEETPRRNRSSKSTDYATRSRPRACRHSLPSSHMPSCGMQRLPALTRVGTGHLQRRFTSSFPTRDITEASPMI
jgi:hypothetical protein